MQKVEVLIAAMYQNNLDVIDSTKIQSDVLLINQCDTNDYYEDNSDYGKIRCISTTERGLSKSRNMALRNARGDYCLICDDDEILYDGYSEKIIKAFNENKDVDIICFKMDYGTKRYFQNKRKIGYLRALRISSCQIVFRPVSLKNADVAFDENFGTGTIIGSGEENILLYDCLKKGLKIIYVPVCLGKVNNDIDSTWFSGFNDTYFFNKGVITGRLMGKVFGLLYCSYFVLGKYKRYKNENSFVSAFYNIIKGLFHNYKNKITQR